MTTNHDELVTRFRRLLDGRDIEERAAIAKAMEAVGRDHRAEIVLEMQRLGATYREMVEVSGFSNGWVGRLIAEARADGRLN